MTGRRVDLDSASARGQATTGTTDLRRFKPYPAYKDSGIDWLGEIPARWNVAPIYARYRVELGKMLDAKRVTGETLGLYLRNVDVQWDSINTADLPEMDFAPSERDRFRLQPGDLLVCEGGEVGRTAIWHGDIAVCYYQKAIHRMRQRNSDEHPRFFFYLMYALAKRGVFAGMGNQNTIDHLTSVQLRHYRLPFPHAREQRTIAVFLDRETDKIDALVEKKEQLLVLLQEERAALITRSVTKGLDPTVPLKSSGLEEAGEIPDHWTVKPFTKYIAEKADYRGKTPEKVPSGVFLVTARNVKMGLIDYECSEEFVAQDEYDMIMRRGRPRKGDLLFTTEAPLGNVALVDREDIALAQRVIRFRMNPSHFEERFTLFAMMSQYFQVQLARLSTGSTAVGLKASKLPMLRLIGPPTMEQDLIAQHLQRETARIDVLVAKVRDAIDRLDELRTALISAAVTGKIDVREEIA